MTDIALIRAWVRRAKGIASASGATLAATLDSINDAILGSGVQDGQVILSTSEAGGQVAFAIPQGMTPLDLARINEEAIAWCNQFTNPENPPMTQRRIKRLRVSFFRAKP